MTDFLPISPGLLVSMAIRADHSFGMHMGHYEGQHDTLEEKQIKLIRDMATIYRERQIVTDRQLIEEMTGTGFYSFQREHIYREYPTALALQEAINQATSILNDQQDA